MSITRPTISDARLASWVAALSGVKFMSFMICRTLLRVASEMVGELLITLETVDLATLAALAISLIVIFMNCSHSVFEAGLKAVPFSL
ncbi:hypothetical protein D3C75_1001550 [compost metagenome]